MELSSLKPELDARGLKLTAVAMEKLGHEEFLRDYWKGELFLDEPRSLHTVMGGLSQGLVTGAFSYITGGAVATNLKRCDTKGVEGDLKGEGRYLGGVWVVSRSEGVVYEHREESWGDICTVDEIMKAVDQISTMKDAVPATEPLVAEPAVRQCC